MEMISFRCSSCNQEFKVGADKAGRRTKCARCGTMIIVPSSTGIVAASPPSQPALEDDDDGKAYGILDEPKPTVNEQKTTTREKKKEEKFVKRKVKKRNIQFADDWRKMTTALVLFAAGLGGWMLNWLLHVTLVLLGFFSSIEYSTLVVDCQQDGNLNMGRFLIGLLAGPGNIGVGRALLIIEYVVYLLAGVAFLAGYFICLAVPDRNGTRGQAFGLVGVGVLNLLIGVLFKLLPAAGVMSYVMVPFFAPEIVFSEINIERVQPLHVFWSSAPAWEVFAAILFQVSFFAEPVLLSVFMRAVGLALRDDEVLEPRSLGVIRLGLGQFFILFSFYMISINGTSTVVRTVLIVIYLLWRGFLLGYLIRFLIYLINARKRIEYLLEPAEDTED
jgi:DNA-directed RNA polymerase subunit RPC12/RpoP